MVVRTKEKVYDVLVKAYDKRDCPIDEVGLINNAQNLEGEELDQEIFDRFDNYLNYIHNFHEHKVVICKFMFIHADQEDHEWAIWERPDGTRMPFPMSAKKMQSIYECDTHGIIKKIYDDE